MLCSLIIENLAIVSHLELDFSHGMTAFTGETGAGKSIMLDALMLAMGERADASIVRAGEEKCSVSALFNFEAHSEVSSWLEAHDIFDPSTLEVCLRRVVYAEGRSKAYINGQLFPLQKVKALSELLLDIHGQHQHQRLFYPATHRMQLDEYANHHALLADVQHAFDTYQTLKQQRDALLATTTEKAHIDLLTYQINELDALQLEMNEVKQLHHEHHQLAHAKRYLEDSTDCQQLLQNEDRDGQDIQALLHRVTQRLTALPKDNAHIQTAIHLIDSAHIHCEEALREIECFSRQVQLDPERLQQIESRLSLLYDMARKHHIEPDDLYHHWQQLKQKLAAFESIQSTYHELQTALAQASSNYQQAALLLRESRKKYATLLEQEIGQLLKALDMPHGVIQIVITPQNTMQAHGLDKVEYYVSTNPGVSPDALAKMASGGELSRISLAIHVITAKRASTPTLFFDEVDVGIGGATAARVGNLLRTLGERLQVFCVTHQPQVAATAHHHFLVKKHTNADHTHTFSEVISLDGEERITEIARMLSGLRITDETLSHAKALLLA